MPSKLKLTITIILTVSIILSATGFYLNNLAFETSRIQPILEEKFLGKVTEIGNYSDKDYYSKQEPEILVSKYDLIHSIFSIVLNDCVPLSQYTVYKPKNECDSFTIITFHLERTGILTWKVLDFYVGSILHTTIEKTRNLIKNNDIANLPRELDGQSIGVSNKLSTEQIEITKTQQKQTETTKNINALPKEQKQKICEENLAKFTKLYEASLKGEKVDGDIIAEQNLEASKRLINTTDCSKV